MMTFRSAYIRLTLFYVLIVMVISVSFSAVLYGISYRELGRGLNRQAQTICDGLMGSGPKCSPLIELEKIRHAQLDESKIHLLLNLIYFNLMILLASAILSYLLAKQTLRPIEEMVEAQQRFTADASHELKTPLTAMKTEIEVALRDKQLSIDGVKELLNSNLEEINKLEALASALLRLSKYKEETKLEFTQLELTDILITAFEKVESFAKSKSIKFKTNLDEAKIHGDRASLVELFVILLDNAIKYSAEKSQISLEISKVDKTAIVKVKDQGAGIAEKDLAFIFDRFYRADASRTQNETHGYGLGLAIAKSIVELHGATISVDSMIKKGTTFEVKFNLD